MPRRVILLGAGGFIGRHIALALQARSYEPLCVARATGALDAAGLQTLRADMEDPATHAPGFWKPYAAEAVAAVNAAGLLSAAPARLRAVHVLAPAALYAALPDDAAIVLISATGIEADTAFGRARGDGEETARAAARRLSLLRPGLVLGETSYGGSSVLRGLAAMPLRIPVVGDGAQTFDPVHAADLAELVADRIAHGGSPAPIPVGGADTVTQGELLMALRGWLGQSPAPLLRLPLPLARALGRIGDAMQLGPISAAAVAQLQHGVLTPRTGRIELPGFHSFTARRPAGAQDLWHSRLYLLRPLLRIVLAIVWLASGLLGLLLPLPVLSQATNAALPEALTLLTARGFGLLDIAIALTLLRGWRPLAMVRIQFAVILGYTAALTAIHPALWLDPFGGLLKNLPILALLFVQRILEQER